MSTHNICFCGEIRKISTLLDWKKGLNWSYVGKFHQILTELSALHMIVARYYRFTFLLYLAPGFMLVSCLTVIHTSVHPLVFSFLDDNLGKYQLIFIKLGICIVEIWFGVAYGQNLSVVEGYLPSTLYWWGIIVSCLYFILTLKAQNKLVADDIPKLISLFFLDILCK